MGDEYKRTVDRWVKLSLVLTPFVSGAVSWGVLKTTIATLDGRISKVEHWVDAQNGAMVEAAKAAGRSAEQQTEMNRRLERIEVILDSRLHR